MFAGETGRFFRAKGFCVLLDVDDSTAKPRIMCPRIANSVAIPRTLSFPLRQSPLHLRPVAEPGKLHPDRTTETTHCHVVTVPR
jgi:hypothetical protein